MKLSIVFCLALSFFYSLLGSLAVSADSTSTGEQPSVTAQLLKTSKSIVVDGEEVIATVNINTATAEVIASTLKGIGPQKAQAIVEWREANGEFTRADQLLSIKGIGHKILDANKDRIQL